MESITLYELLERTAESALELQREDGSFPSGRNYTYDEPETPVRTTSHWTVILSEVYKITGKEKFRKASVAAVNYLLSDETRPHGYSYHCRDESGKDRCNGLIGQAHPIRALAHAGPILGHQDAINIAEEVFMMHPFDEELGLWERVEINGKKLSFDRTLNHQIVFAAGSSKLVPVSSVAANRISRFLDQLPSNIELHPDGLIKHYIRPPPIKISKTVFGCLRHWPLLMNEVVFHYYSRSSERRKKEIGYQPVNLRALAQLRTRFQDHKTWSNKKIQPSLRTGNVDDCNNVTYGSVIPGISFAWVAHAFLNDIEKTKYLIEKDLQKKLNFDTHLLESNLVDSMDMSSAASLLVDLPDVKLNL